MPQQFQCPGFRGAHPALLGRVQVVVAGQVQPAVHEVEGELGGEGLG
jgi:hypothetical protein